MGPLPHSEQILNDFIRFTFWNAYSKMKVKGGAEQLHKKCVFFEKKLIVRQRNTYNV